MCVRRTLFLSDASLWKGGKLIRTAQSWKLQSEGRNIIMDIIQHAAQNSRRRTIPFVWFFRVHGGRTTAELGSPHSAREGIIKKTGVATTRAARDEKREIKAKGARDGGATSGIIRRWCTGQKTNCIRGTKSIGGNILFFLGKNSNNTRLDKIKSSLEAGGRDQ